ncbi:MAG: DUF1127 domain-containing protein [Hyphomicrobiales bacterium]|nr:DUF1127 domain-containing protein [Hyphomicrobiales bacterium]
MSLRSAHQGVAIMSRFSDFLTGVSERYKAARYNEVLTRMSDRQLVDIGLSRTDIPRHARDMARGR